MKVQKIALVSEPPTENELTAKHQAIQLKHLVEVMILGDKVTEYQMDYLKEKVEALIETMDGSYEEDSYEED
ncbi:hypothetical protein SAE01_32380 [Segetibacter aerophilus]|uniref:Uncharacterized protein n=2 Tax=Segetibacter aerophilus TaxID=670293 RepID=A0A512BFK4_9BACT|nr:hypothetical protein SAE01_32380 [Segetibacter aerophilus]